MERSAKRRHLPFLTAMAKAKKDYALDMTTDDFIESAYDVWRSIGNIAVETHRYITRVPDDFIIELPNEAEFIDSVTVINKKLLVSTFDSGGRKDRHIPAVTEHSTVTDENESLQSTPGHSVNYILLDNNSIKITSPDLLNADIMVIYKSILLDDDGLPMLNDKEVAAIAAETARKDLTRKMFQGVGPNTNSALVTMFQVITGEAARLMAAAKVDEKITKDGLDKLLDIKTSWDRKVYNKRLKFMK